jgi:hypothetical protein
MAALAAQELQAALVPVAMLERAVQAALRPLPALALSMQAVVVVDSQTAD